MRLIDAERFDVFDAVKPEKYDIESFMAGMEAVLDAIKCAPTIEPKQEWIPCEERLPEEKGKEYLVTLACIDAGEYQMILQWYDGWNCSKGHRRSEIHNVIAWMSLPEPYVKGVEK